MLITIITTLLLSQIAYAQSNCGSVPSSYKVQDGYEVQIVANNIENPKGIVVDRSGTAYVVSEGNGIMRLGLGCNNHSMVIEDDDLNYGIALDKEEQYLYASSQSSVVRWGFPALESNSQQQIVTGMQSQGEYKARPILVLEIEDGRILVSKPVDSDSDRSTWDLEAGKGQVRNFVITNVPNNGFEWLDGNVTSHGLVNEMGLAEDWYGDTWGIGNSPQGLTKDGARIDVAVELNWFGDPNRPRDWWYGFPACFNTWTPAFGKGTGEHFALNPNSTWTDATCAEKQSNTTRLALEPNTDPMSLQIEKGGPETLGPDEGGSGWVALHGGRYQNRNVGYKVVRVLMVDYLYNRNTIATTERHTNQDISSPEGMGYEDFFYNEDNGRCPDNCFRPSGLALDTFGRMWITSDSTGEVFVVSRVGQQEAQLDQQSSGGSSSEQGSSSSSTPSAGNKAYISYGFVVLVLILLYHLV